jgi:hypothetical protein
MRRLLSYAFVLGLGVAIGAYIALDSSLVDEPTDSVSPSDADATAPETASAAAKSEAAPPATPASAASVDKEIAKRLALETAKAERRLLAPGNREASSSAPSDAGAATGAADPASSPSGGVVPAMAAPPVPTDASQDAKSVNDAARPAAPSAETNAAPGAQLAALAPDEICERDEERLAQLRMSPSRGEAERFANELGCEKLRPQVLALVESLTPPPAAMDAPDAASPGAQAENEAARPAPAPASANVGSATSDETCQRDQDRLVRLRSSPSAEEVLRFASELGCEKLRPQLQRLMDSLDLGAPSPQAHADALRPNPLLDQACASERSALDRVRQEPSAEAAGQFWRDMQCEGLRPQVRLLLESLNVAPDSVGSAAAPSDPEAPQAKSDAPTAIGVDPGACRRETAELNRVRSTPDLGDAKRFADTVTCDALRPQVARLLESFGN